MEQMGDTERDGNEAVNIGMPVEETRYSELFSLAEASSRTTIMYVIFENKPITEF